MITLIAVTFGAAGGAGFVWLSVRGRLDQLRWLTDRDERGRFVRREPKS